MKNPEERLKQKELTIKAYQRLFDSKDGQIVLEDLRKRCFYDFPARSMPGQPDYVRDQNEGLRLAFLHIQNRIKYNLNDLKLTNEDE